MDKKFNVIITGTGSGIGQATALHFAEKDANVFLTDISEASFKKTKQILEKEKLNFSFFPANLTIESDVKLLMDNAFKTLGHIDSALNIAGTEGAQSLTADYTEENWDFVINNNLKATWLCLKHEIKGMVNQKNGGVIVNMASIAGIVGSPFSPAYGAAKAGIIELTKTTALEYSKKNIRVNVISPGAVETPMLFRCIDKNPKLKDHIIKTHPIGRASTPDEIAKAFWWMATSDSSYVTGHNLVIDGGFTAI